MSKFFLSVALLLSLFAGAQQKHRIAIFTPFYLDSSFDATGRFRFEKTGSKLYTAGLDFYYGAQMALDSLEKNGIPLEVFVYDIKSGDANTILKRPELQNLELIIAQSNYTETKKLADVALARKIPFVSATFPNDAGVSNNPYFVLLNSTLQTHIESIYDFIQKYDSEDRVVVFRKPGAQEDLVKRYINEYAKAKTGKTINLKFVDLPANMNPQSIIAQLDSTKRNVCIAGSLDESFGMRLAQTLNTLNEKYSLRLIGMPNWDNFSFAKLDDLEIVYSTPFFYNRTNTLETELSNAYNQKMNTRPGDLFYRGFETVFHFASLLAGNGKDVASSLSNKGDLLINEFNIQPVIKDSSDMSLDYFENKRVYMIRALGGVRNILN